MKKPVPDSGLEALAATTAKIGPEESSRDEPVGFIVYVSAPEPEQGRNLRVEAGAVTIGRDGPCDLCIDDASISRQHVRLTATPQGIHVEDLGSTNGVFYLGKQIERATLKLGARIELGRCALDLLPLPDGRSVQPFKADRYGELVGASLPMRRLFAVMQLLEPSEVPVLIEGETGTGKELVARALHAKSRRAKKPFVVINCASVPAELMESEFFGHCKGSFTGAVANRAGAFEEADGGTVFLDELGELPMELQPKLLRVLETGEVKRVGEVHPLEVDVRILAATHRDLADDIKQGRFRSDLYYRIAVVYLHLPPLRERPEDIALLVEHLSQQCAAHQDRKLPPEAMDLLLRHDWPGNVRELRNVIQRALALGIVSTEPRSATHLPVLAETAAEASAGPETEPSGPFRASRDRALEEFERRYLLALWRRHEGNLSAAAREADIDRKYLRDLLKKYGIH